VALAARLRIDRGMTAHNLEHGEVDLLIRKLKPVSKLAFPERPASIGSHPPTVVRDIYVPRRAGVVRACVALGVVLGAALPFWPYPRGCGWGLDFYLASVEMVVIAGVWGARQTWDTRLGFTHLIALGTILWGFVLTALQVLPRIGYAKQQATWFCQ
jgi:hypothetical protein